MEIIDFCSKYPVGAAAAILAATILLVYLLIKLRYILFLILVLLAALFFMYKKGVFTSDTLRSVQKSDIKSVEAKSGELRERTKEKIIKFIEKSEK